MQIALIIADACVVAAIIVGGIYLSHFQEKFKKVRDAHIGYLEAQLREAKEKAPRELVKEILDTRQLKAQVLADKQQREKENAELKKMADALKEAHTQQSAEIDQLVDAAMLTGFRKGLDELNEAIGCIFNAIHAETLFFEHDLRAGFILQQLGEVLVTNVQRIKATPFKVETIFAEKNRLSAEMLKELRGPIFAAIMSRRGHNPEE